MKSTTQTNGEYEDHKEMLFVQGVSQSSMLYLCRVETVRLAGGFALVDNILLVKLLQSAPHSVGTG